jgi:hypothetical protein
VLILQKGGVVKAFVNVNINTDHKRIHKCAARIFHELLYI